jgi:hypothetical protein
MRRWGRWTYDDARLELIHDNGCRRIDLNTCTSAGPILDTIAQIAGKPRDEQPAEDVGDLVLALNELLQLQQWVCGGGDERTVINAAAVIRLNAECLEMMN